MSVAKGNRAMEISRIKVKIGEHEFDAEGPIEVVKEQFSAFKELLSSTSAHAKSSATATCKQNIDNKSVTESLGSKALDNIMHCEGRIVSLTAIPPTIEDSALLIMLGHKDLRDNSSVTGQEIGDGLAQSGKKVARVDRVMQTAIEQSLVLKTGIKRATRYRLTNQGLAKAISLAKELIETVA